MIFSQDELRDIFIAIITMTVVFAYSGPNLGSFAQNIPAAFIVVVTSFLLHELAHKFVAIKFGVKAFFKLWPFGVIVGLIFMFLPPLKILAPGSVVIYPQRFGRWKRRFEKYSRFTEITIKQIGIIAAVGPLVNIILALFAWSLMSTVLPDNAFLAYLVLINSWLAIINLIPFNPLDGAKVFTWKPWLWLVLIVVSAIFLLNVVPSFIR